MTAPFSA